jgi:diaminohydroxyphosphoribosylaminopyrimidine deaminase/5-amino-6-(5-phosphoribosylamino)uracil reductase
MSSQLIADVEFMSRALTLARRGLYTTDPNPRVGCVLVRDGEIVGEGWHERAGESHAEVNAIQQAGDKARGATAYVTLEPCCHTGRTPPCTQALVDAGVIRVVAAMEDPNPLVAGRGLAALADADIKVENGLLRSEAEKVNPGFISRMRLKRPYVRIKLAISLDGKTAMANGESKWITGDAARADVQRLRARSSAILTGSGTVLSDDPSLNVRDVDIGRQPLRVIVDANLSTPETAKMLKLDGSTLIATATEEPDLSEMLIGAGAEIILLPAGPNKVDLPALMQHLAAQEVNELLVEAGSTLCGSLLESKLVDELVIYLAPHIMGHDARGMFRLPAMENMADRISLNISDVRAVGKDWRITATPEFS